MINWLRSNKIAAGFLAVLRVFIGSLWLIHGIEKLTGGFSATGFLNGIVASPVVGPSGDMVYPWYNAFIENFALPFAGIFNVLVPVGELLIGIALITGTLTTMSAFLALVMNFAFVLGGSISENPTFILVEFIILMAGMNAGRFGGDRWVIPWIRQNVFSRFKKDKQAEQDEGLGGIPHRPQVEPQL